MRAFFGSTLLVLIGVSGVLHSHAQDRPALSDTVVAILPIQNRAGDLPVAAELQQALRHHLGFDVDLVDPGRTRAAIRRYRIRDVDTVLPSLLPQLAEELEADWILVTTLHDVERRGVPRVTVSARAYSGATGELLWTGFEAGSGLDTETALGLGVIGSAEGLVQRMAERLTVDLRGTAAAPGAVEENCGTVAVVPFDSLTKNRRTANAGTATEATRAALFRRGFRVAAPGCAHEVLRRHQAGLWGGVVPLSREGLQRACGAELIVTGAVEAYEIRGPRDFPEPRVAIALRLLDPVSGKILWMGALEEDDQRSPGLFRTGRVYSRGAMAEQITMRLVRRMLKDRTHEPVQEEENG